MEKYNRSSLNIDAATQFAMIQGPLSQQFKTSKHIIRWNSP